MTRSDGARVRYVEDKTPDLALVGQILEESREANHWANFGPVSRRLEARIAQLLRLDPGLEVVMCASGSVALQALATLHESIRIPTDGRRRGLRWVTSAFGYFSAIQGSLRSAKVADCDERSFLDLGGLDPDAFDGLIVTNAFGIGNDLSDFRRYADLHDKILLVDAAMALGSHRHGPNEIISFHHTKPWGFGEGGCAIVESHQAQRFRSLISFGTAESSWVRRLALNGKISDPACALQLAHLERTVGRRAQFLEQYRRLVGLGLDLGLTVLGDVHEHPGIPACVPFQLPVSCLAFRHPELPTGKYYFPLEPRPMATRLFDHMLNVPCHPGMAELTDQAIRDALGDLLRGAGVVR